MFHWLAEKLKLKSLREKIGTFKAVWPFIWPKKMKTKLKFVGATAMSLASSAINVMLPYVFGKVVESFSAEGTVAKLAGVEMGPISLILTYGTLWTLSKSSYHIRTVMVNGIIWDAQTEFSAKMIEHVADLSVPYRSDPNHHSSITQQVINRTEWAMVDLVRSGLFDTLPNLAEMIGSIFFIHQYYGPSYSSKLCLLVSVYSAYTIKVGEWVAQSERDAISSFQAVGKKVNDSMLNFQTAEYNANISYEKNLCRKQLEIRGNAGNYNDWRSGVLNLGQNVILVGGFTFMFYQHATNILSGKFTANDIVLLNSYVTRFINPLGMMGNSFNTISKSLQELVPAVEILNEKPLISEASSPQTLTQQVHEIEFKNLTFNYPNTQQQILKNLSFTIQSGQRIAFVGETGSGKSTLLKLLFRFYDPTSGEILIDGINIKSLTLQSLRQAIAIVPQETGLFNRTLLENVKYGDLAATDAEIQQAVTESQLSSFFEKENHGFDSLVGEGGVTLSGGEKQRISICRALLKKKMASIYVLDEATSALDAETENNFMKTFNQISSGCTVIIIAHRLSTIKNCDTIYVLENGQIIQQGTHETLLADTQGKYLQLWNKQSEHASSSTTYSEGSVTPISALTSHSIFGETKQRNSKPASSTDNPIEIVIESEPKQMIRKKQ